MAMVKRILEYPIEQKLSNMIWPEISALEQAGRPIGGNRASAFEYHYLYSCDCLNNEFQDWLNHLDDTIDFRLYGCYEWERHPLRITRKFGGFSVYFSKGPPFFEQMDWTRKAKFAS